MQNSSPGSLYCYLSGIITKRAGRSGSRGYCTCKFFTAFATENAAIVMRRASNGSELGNSRFATPLTTAPARGGVRRNGAAEFILGHRDILLILREIMDLRKDYMGQSVCGKPAALDVPREYGTYRTRIDAQKQHCSESSTDRGG